MFGNRFGTNSGVFGSSSSVFGSSVSVFGSSSAAGRERIAAAEGRRDRYLAEQVEAGARAEGEKSADGPEPPRVERDPAERVQEGLHGAARRAIDDFNGSDLREFPELQLPAAAAAHQEADQVPARVSDDPAPAADGPPPGSHPGSD